MPPHGHPNAQITRRDVVKVAALGVLGAGSMRASGDAAAAASARRAVRDLAARRRPRVAIVGAGAGGVTAAYLLSGSFDVDVFEARSKIGGHCDSHAIEYRGRRVIVDLGAQFFHPATHPVYVTLLEELGLYDPADPGGRDTVQAPATLCIFPAAGGPPIFSSTHPFATPQRTAQFAQFTALARHAVLTGLPWEVTVKAWVHGLAVSPTFKAEVVYPWITALIGSPRADALRASARSILQTVALTFPADLTQPVFTYNSAIGLQGNLQRMLGRAGTARVHLRAPARGLARTRAGWFVQTPQGRRGPYRHLVLNAPPHVGRTLLRPVAGFAQLAGVLDHYRYFGSRLLIHRDPIYVERDRRYWAVYNAGVRAGQSEGSVWYGGLDPRLASGATVDLFKSWATHRRAAPAQVLLARRYQHPIIDRSAIEAARALRGWQGRHGLHLSGQYTTGFDSQESAVYSAIEVARALAPRSPALLSLQARLAARGHAGISYAL